MRFRSGDSITNHSGANSQIQPHKSIAKHEQLGAVFSLAECCQPGDVARPLRCAASLRLAACLLAIPGSLTLNWRSETANISGIMATASQRLAAHRSGKAIRQVASFHWG